VAVLLWLVPVLAFERVVSVELCGPEMGMV